MEFLNKLVDISFKKDLQGRPLFYPWGYWGSGFIVEPESKQDQIRNFLKNIYTASFIIPLVFLLASSSDSLLQNLIAASLLILLPLLLWYYFSVKNLTKDFQKTSEKLTFSEVSKKSGQLYSLKSLIFGEVGSLLFVIAGAWLFGRGGEEYVTGLLSIIFFGFAAITYGYMII